MNGNIETIERWMKAYATRITRFAAGMVGDEETAQDIAQEVFIRAYHNLDRFRGEASPYTYLYRIAGNLTMDYCRTDMRKSRRELRESDQVGDEPHSLLESLPDTDTKSRPENAALRNEELSTVRKAIAQLPPRYRQPAVLYYLEDQNIGEISRLTGVPAGTVKSRLFRARKSLARALDHLL